MVRNLDVLTNEAKKLENLAKSQASKEKFSRAADFFHKAKNDYESALGYCITLDEREKVLDSVYRCHENWRRYTKKSLRKL